MSHGALKNLNVSGATFALSLAKISSGTEFAASGRLLHVALNRDQFQDIDTIHDPTHWPCPCRDGLHMEVGIGDPWSGRICYSPPQNTSPPHDGAFSAVVATPDGAAVSESQFASDLQFSDTPVVYVSNTPNAAILLGYLAVAP